MDKTKNVLGHNLCMQNFLGWSIICFLLFYSHFSFASIQADDDKQVKVFLQGHVPTAIEDARAIAEMKKTLSEQEGYNISNIGQTALGTVAGGGLGFLGWWAGVGGVASASSIAMTSLVAVSATVSGPIVPGLWILGGALLGGVGASYFTRPSSKEVPIKYDEKRKMYYKGASLDEIAASSTNETYYYYGSDTALDRLAKESPKCSPRNLRKGKGKDNHRRNNSLT